MIIVYTQIGLHDCICIDRFSKFADSAVKFACFNDSVILMQIDTAAAARRKIYGGGGCQFRLVRQRADFFGGGGASRFRLTAAARFGG